MGPRRNPSSRSWLESRFHCDCTTGPVKSSEPCRESSEATESTPEGCVYPDSCCRSVILVNQPAESIDADDYTVTPMPGGSRLGRLERQASVRSFFVVVPQVLSEDPLQVALPEDREVAQALAPHCLHAARGKGARLRERSGVGMMRTPSLLNTSARGPANLASRSRMRKRISARRPSIARLRAGWVTLSRARMGRNAGQVHPPG